MFFTVVTVMKHIKFQWLPEDKFPPVKQKLKKQENGIVTKVGKRVFWRQIACVSWIGEVNHRNQSCAFNSSSRLKQILSVLLPVLLIIKHDCELNLNYFQHQRFVTETRDAEPEILWVGCKALKRYSNHTLIDCRIHSNQFSRLRATR